MTSSLTSKYEKLSECGQYYYDEDAAERVVKFIERFCTHIKGELAGQPIILEDWQKDDIIRPAFGWKLMAGDARRYSTVYVEIPRKNGKSALGACIALYLLCADREPGAEVYSAAGDREQARLVFEPAKKMVENSPFLSKRLKGYKNSVVHEKSNSFYKVISADANTKHGFNAHGIIFDELHVQPNRELYDVLTTSVGARRQPMTFIITTAGIKDSFGEEMHNMALQIRDGILEDDSFLPVIYCADPEDDIKDLEVWKKANPGLGVIIKLNYLKKQLQKALNQPSFLNTFKQLHLNIWTGAITAWLSDNEWKIGNQGRKSEEELAGRDCFAALDLSATRDLTCFGLLFPWDDGSFYFHPMFWCPEDTVRWKSENENVNYQVWVDAGYIITTPGNFIDFDFIIEYILEECEKYNVINIAVDRWRLHQFSRLMNEEIKLFPYGQGFRDMSPAIEHAEKILLAGRLNHYGHPVMKWMLNNLMLESDAAGNKKPSKRKSKNKIDGMVVKLMAIGSYFMWLADEDNKPSKYETEGIKTL